MVKSSYKTYAGGIVAAIMLCVLLGLNQTHLSPDDAEDYHANVREVVSAIPRSLGPWEGVDEEATPAAIELLRPNILLTRRYTHRVTGDVVSLLLVHCKDARDLMGHYPPVCYPSQGWRVVEDYQPRNRLFEDHPARADWALYPFTHGSSQNAAVDMMVYNKMLLPDGSSATQMSDVQKVAGNYQRRHYGAATVQLIVHEGHRSEAEASIQPLIDALAPVREAVFADSRVDE
jgi:hypothetical protein